MNNKVIHHPWAMTLVGGLFFFYNFIQMTLFNPLGLSLMKAFSLDPVEFGSIGGSFFLAVAIMALPGGMIADKFRTKHLLLGLTAATIINLLLTAQTTDPAVLGVLRFIQGLIHAFALTVPMKLATQWMTPKRMALASSLLVTIGLFGGAICQPLMTYWDENFGLANALYYNAILGGAVFLLFAIVIRDNPTFWKEHHAPTWGHYLKDFKISLFNSQNWLGGFYVLMLNLPVIILGAGFGQIYMEKTHHLGAEQASFIISLLFFGLMAGGPLLGHFSDSLHSRKKPMWAGSLLSLGVLAAIILVPGFKQAGLVILFACLGVTTASQVLVYPMVAESNPPKYMGSSLSIVTLVIMGGNAVASALFGWLLEHNTVQTAWGIEYTADSFRSGMWMMWGAIALSLILLACMKESFKHHE